ncbi:ABC transporter ATP-binding protein [Fictibacillus aquaticus]|uniref:Lipoprotein-releasing system ATP-binding protein LolD n=1 Tax=Fictibacillus aquaticus TaxID=2021314 RepID=A0A235F617_9BACL|nr:ABC transporter ATP-binding protein [Fictibacillus aquaticus]OYD56377.1 lipoprotein-releasing system ATP-binding protein LolD [Fictibacillus aquaticus]
MTHIITKNVSKVFSGDGVLTSAVENITLSFHQKDFTSIVGPSGSGKSTLLSLIGTLDQPSSGQIFYDDTNVTSLKNNQLADFRFEKIGFVFQQFHLLPTLTALENVLAPLFSRKVNYHKEKRAKELLEQVGLKDKLHSFPSQLSGGQQQRVAVARALIHSPEWLLADEPTGNLDTESGEVIFSLLKQLNQNHNCGIILVTHDMKLAQRTDRVIKMVDGQLVSDTNEVAI